MNVYNIAGLNVGLECQLRTMQRAAKYMNPDFCGIPDFTIKTTAEQIASIQKPDWTEEIKAYVYEGKLFYKKLIEGYNGTMIHSSAVVVDDKAYLISAPSGIGKSTHTAFWLEKFPGKAYILNDDKPAVRIINNEVFAYGTPWSGKNDINVNKKVKVQGICFLERDNNNWIKPMAESEKFINMYHSSIRKIEKSVLINMLDVISLIIDRVPIYQLGCTPTIDAANLAYEIMSGGL